MESDNQYQKYPEDIELEHFVDLKDIEKPQKISFKRQVANQEFEDMEIELLIPDCVENGTIFRIRNKGHIGATRKGNVYIVIHIMYKGVYSTGGDVHTFKHINYFHSKIAFKVDIYFLNEILRVKIPKNIKNGQILCFKGQGYYNSDSHQKGDLYIKIIINKPKNHLQSFFQLILFFFSPLTNFLKYKIDDYLKNQHSNTIDNSENKDSGDDHDNFDSLDNNKNFHSFDENEDNFYQYDNIFANDLNKNKGPDSYGHFKKDINSYFLHRKVFSDDLNDNEIDSYDNFDEGENNYSLDDKVFSDDLNKNNVSNKNKNSSDYFKKAVLPFMYLYHKKNENNLFDIHDEDYCYHDEDYILYYDEYD
ncbi:MAG: hypothetical protein LBU74_02695 [Methanobacteriaceae archaeon]|jgi:hypothetical protein|nr:hypothetical protein [Candidatus Methanorudis spinitermitis]